jgi:3-oxoacyl-[acyl-carrier protein] reductase
VIDTDVEGFFSVAKTAIPVFRNQRDGALIAITTAATRHYPTRDALSAVPKAAIEQLVVAIAKEEGRFGIRANCVAPGMIDAGLGARMLTRDFEPSVSDAFMRSIPLRRFGTCADISSVVTFLASSGARYVSGQIIGVDGGWQL